MLTTPETDGSNALLPQAHYELSVEEVRQLWSFVHGDIMDGSLRQLLRGSLGLCPRHAWGHAVVEIELWQSGAGKRGGHQPFDVAILYEDLLDFAAKEFLRPASMLRHGLARIPTAHGRCRICHEMGGPQPTGIRLGYANSDSAALAAEANALTYTSAWCRETCAVWASQACGVCAGRPTADGQLLCRRHLSDAGPVSRETGHAVANRLLGIRTRLLRLIDSMTDTGEPATAADDSSWIEAMGWFAGWGLPLYLAGK